MKQLITKLHKINRFNCIKTGLLIAGLAICFIIDRTYFFYPPQLAPAWNSLAVDIIGLLAGLTLILCGVLNVRIDFVMKIALCVSVAFLTVLVVAEFFHIYGAGYFRFHPTIVLEVYAIINLMQLAYEYDPD